MKLLFNFLALALAARGGGQRAGAANPLKKSANSIRKNGLDVLFNQVEVDKNMVISPLSIIGCMYMLAAGAAGESREEILTALDFGKVFDSNSVNAVKQPFKMYKQIVDELSSQPENGYTLAIANGMFYQKGMEEYNPANAMSPQYVNLLKEDFIQDASNIQEVDFIRQAKAATDLINTWVKAKTQSKIPKLFKQPLDSDTLVVLASTLYFKASWNQKFDIMKNRDIKNLCWATTANNLMNSECDNVTWMKKEESIAHLAYTRQSGGTNVFEIPLKNGKGDDVTNKFSMQIWAPGTFITNPTDDAEFRQFIKDNIGSFRKKASKKQKATIIMPKFSLEYSDDIISSLQSLGIEKVFSQTEADLSPMLGNDAQAYVSKVTHAVKFDLDEDGVEGAAVTAAEISSRTFSQPIRLEINKPFYFVVSNRCWTEGGGEGKSCPYGNIPLFIGRVVNPN